MFFKILKRTTPGSKIKDFRPTITRKDGKRQPTKKSTLLGTLNIFYLKEQDIDQMTLLKTYLIKKGKLQSLDKFPI